MNNYRAHFVGGPLNGVEMAVDGEPTPDILTPANLTRPYLKDGEIIALPYTHIYTVLTKIGSKYGFAWEGCIYVYRGTKS